MYHSQPSQIDYREAFGVLLEYFYTIPDNEKDKVRKLLKKAGI
jgi:hypothetical protein